MNDRIVKALVVTLVCFACMGVAGQPSRSNERFLLSPPTGSVPVKVQARFELHSINEINDSAETFEFTGILTLKWHDARRAFDPAVAGVAEKVFQGDFQVKEVGIGWYPQVVIVNASGAYEKSGVVLRVLPDGTSTLTETVNATAESEGDIFRYPFDRRRLEAIFEIPGFSKDEVIVEAVSDDSGFRDAARRLPQWSFKSASGSVRDRQTAYDDAQRVSSVFVVSADVQRQSFYILRLVIIPLILIVLLSFSVFWMDRSSIGDRLNVSFIGILTSVGYQLVVGDLLPRVSYFTLIHLFLTVSFVIMCATVVVNLLVATLDRAGKVKLGDRLDQSCRWLFPVSYFGYIIFMLGLARLY